MVHVLTVVAMVGHPFLLPMGRIVGPIQVEHNALRTASPSSFHQIELDQHASQAVAGGGIDRVLQPAEGGLAGEIRLLWQAATDQLQEVLAITNSEQFRSRIVTR
jgi:hypothetical protein